jgi:hypothetical protein
MARASVRTQACGPAEARRRLDHARSFLEVAELTADVNDLSLEYASVAASVAILAGSPLPTQPAVRSSDAAPAQRTTMTPRRCSPRSHPAASAPPASCAS